MPRRSIDEMYERARANSRDLTVWMLHNQDTIAGWIAKETGGLTTTMAVIAEARIVGPSGRRPSKKLVAATWAAITALPNRPHDEVLPGVRTLIANPSVALRVDSRPAAVPPAGPGPPETAAVVSPGPTSGDWALSQRSARRPKMPKPVKT